MKVRFKGKYLEDENGRIVEVTFEDLLEACLDNSFDSVSVSKIIFQGVVKVTRFEVIRSRDYGKSELYRMLEREIQADSSYKQAKDVRAKENISIREKKAKEARGAYAVYSNVGRMKYLRKKAIKRMRPYKAYHH